MSHPRPMCVRGNRRPLTVVVALVVFALAAEPARADDASEAQLHFDLGVNLYGQRQYAQALEHFFASNRLVPNPSVVFNIAQTYGLLRRWSDSFNWYETYLNDFELDADARTRGIAAQAAVRRRVAVVDVRTSPAGAALFVDREELGSVGISPREVAVDPGEHRILSRLDGFRDAEIVVTTARGSSEEVLFTLEQILGMLSIRTEPEGAQVFVEGRDEPLGATPLDAPLGVGSQRVTIRHPGYGEVTRSLTIVDGETTTVRLSLSRIASDVAVLSVTAPSGAHVRVDGEVVGTVPLAMNALSPGAHTIEVAREGREPWTDELVFEPGGVTRISAALEDPSTLHFEDLRVVGYVLGGVALAAGIGVGVGSFLEREAFFAEANPSAEQLERVGLLNVTADAVMIGGVLVLATTFILDLAIGGRPRSRADVVVDR